jgi:hypothetical protein
MSYAVNTDGSLIREDSVIRNELVINRVAGGASGKNSRKLGLGSNFSGMKPGFEGPRKEE